MAQNVVLIPGTPGVSLGTMYQCHEGTMWVTNWQRLDGVENDCSGEASYGPQEVDHFALDTDWHCGGVWNCPYALVRGLSLFYIHSNHSLCFFIGMCFQNITIIPNLAVTIRNRPGKMCHISRIDVW